MKKLVKKLEDLMVAITFAEAGEFDEANRAAENTVETESLVQGTLSSVKAGSESAR